MSGAYANGSAHGAHAAHGGSANVGTGLFTHSGLSTAALSYRSSTALGTQITALQALYAQVQNASPPSSATSADGIAYNLLQGQTLSGLLTSMEALIALDEQLIVYDAQVSEYEKKCQSALTTVASAGVSPAIAAGIGVAAAAIGGTVGFMACKHFGKEA